MSIFFQQEDVDMPDFDIELVQKLLKSEVRKHKFKLGNINYIFCSDHFLLDINIKFLGHDYLTDVITFDYSEDFQISGDVYISTEMVRNNSVTFEQSFANELVRVLGHGLFHLLGYNDKEAEEIKIMRSKEEELIGKYSTHQ